jgi:hypothetical protein
MSERGAESWMPDASHMIKHTNNSIFELGSISEVTFTIFTFYLLDITCQQAWNQRIISAATASLHFYQNSKTYSQTTTIMPPAGTEEQFRFLISCIRFSYNGRIDFTSVADECHIVSKGAA